MRFLSSRRRHPAAKFLLLVAGLFVMGVSWAGLAPSQQVSADTNTTQQIKGGKVKAYAVTTRARLKSLPEIPTADESGLKGFEVTVWHGIWAPHGTPKAAMDKLVKALQAALQDPNVIAKFAELGTEPVPQNLATPAALDAHLKSEIAKWGPIIKKAGVYAD